MDNTKEVQNKEGENTPNSNDQAVEKNTSNENNNSEEVVSISKKELEVLKKKSEDFERSIELKRLNKLEKNNEGDGETRNEEMGLLQKQIEELKDIVTTGQVNQKNSILRDAYREFITENKWADNDDIFSKISDDFISSDVATKDDAIDKLKSIAMSRFPNEYEEHLAAKLKAQALAEANNIGVGGGSGSGVNSLAKNDGEDESQRAKRFDRNYPPNWVANKK